MATITGTSGNDNLDGSSVADTIYGLGGNDKIAGRAGDDKIDAGAGNDSVLGGDGNDNISGGGGNDLIDGGIGNDTIAGEAGDDTLSGGDGDDTMDGGSGDDLMYGGIGVDTMVGGSGVDLLDGGDGNDKLSGGGNDDILIGGLGDDRLDGGAGADTASYAGTMGAVTVNLATGNASGAAGNDTLLNIQNLIGGDGGDTLTGNNLANRIDGGAGDDTITGAAGDDVLIGSAGNDLFLHDAGNDRIDGGADTDTVSYADLSTQSVSIDLSTGRAVAGRETDTLVNIENARGGGAADTLIGNAGANRLEGGAGNDALNAGDGNDVLDGGAGNDTLAGGAGDDTYLINDPGAAMLGDVIVEAANAGTDLVLTSLPSYTLGTNLENLRYASTNAIIGTGNELDNRIEGGAGDDRIAGRAGADTLSGGDGNDVLAGGAGLDAIDGGAGNDTVDYDYAESLPGVTVNLQSGAAWVNLSDIDLLAGIENVLGGAGDDNITGDAGVNRLSGGAGADTLDGGSGADILDGGAGIDRVSYAGASVGVAVNLVTGTGIAGTDTDSLSNIENVTGSGFADTLTGNAASNVLDGGAGNDVLDGGAGNDVLAGGAGDDTYLINDPGAAMLGDVIIEAANGGTDLVLTSLSTYTLGTNLENLRYATTSAIIGTGNELDNRIEGGAGDDRIAGRAGADTLSGGDGNDILAGGAGLDAMDGGAGNDTVDYDYAESLPGVTVNLQSGAASVNPSDTDTLAGIENVLGGAGDDNITGDAGVNRLSGGAGADTLDGGAGIDRVSYAGASVGVAVNLVTGTGIAGTDTDSLSNIENVTGSGFADTLTGNDASNVLDGGAGNDVLDGGAGDDQLAGGSGDDLYYVDSVLDQVAEGENQGHDTVRASGNANLSYTLGANMEDLIYSGTGQFGGTGNALDNLIVGGDGINVLNGVGGNDTLAGGAGNDTLLGGDGNDLLNGSAGIDVVNGGAGVDTVSYAAFGRAVNVDLWSEFARLVVSDPAVVFNDTITNVESVIGSAFDDRLRGTPGDNTLIGGAGNDTITGEFGNDTLAGGAGSDSLNGGAGDDIYLLNDDDLTDSIFEATGGIFTNFGDDTVHITSVGDRSGTSISYSLPRNVEILIYTGNANFTGNGAIISSGSGDDTLVGQAEAGFYDGGAGFDYLDFSLSPAVTQGRTVNLTAGTTTSKLGYLTGYFSGIEGVRGTNVDDILLGDGNANGLFGMDGNDALNGGGGDDFINGGNGDDLLEGGAGNDRLTGGAGNDTFIFRRGATSGDVIEDFITGRSGLSGADKIDLTDFGPGATLLMGIDAAGTSSTVAVIGGSAANFFTVSGVLPTSFDLSDFIFA